MADWEGLNRRRFPRVNYPCLIIVRHDQGDPDVILTHTENIGIGGVSVTLKKNFRLYSFIELELDLLDIGNHIKCQGKVVWSLRRKFDEKRKPLFYDTGVEFVNLDTKERQRIDEIIGRLVK